MQSTVPLSKWARLLACRFYKLLAFVCFPLLTYFFVISFSAAVPFLPFSCNFVCFFTDRFAFDSPKQLSWDVESSLNFPEVHRGSNQGFTLNQARLIFHNMHGKGTACSRWQHHAQPSDFIGYRVETTLTSVVQMLAKTGKWYNGKALLPESETKSKY